MHKKVEVKTVLTQTKEFLQKHPVGFIGISAFLFSIILVYNLLYGILRYSIDAISQTAGSIVQTISTQATQNPSYISERGEETLLSLLLQNEVIQQSLWSVGILYILVAVLAVAFISVLIYVPLRFFAIHTQSKVLSFQKILTIISIWMVAFMIYRFVFLFLNLRYVFIQVVGETTPFDIFLVDRIVVFLFVAGISTSVLYAHSQSIFSSLKRTFLRPALLLLVSAILLVFVILLWFILRLPLGQSFAVIGLLLFFFSAAYLLYVIILGFVLKQAVHIKSQKNQQFTKKPFIIPLVVGICLFIPVIFLTSSLQTSLQPSTADFAFELPSTFKQDLRLEEYSGFVLIEFVDFTCQFCKSSNPLVNQVSTIIPSDQLRIVTRHFLLNELDEGSIRAAMAFECLQQQGFATQAKNELYENQGSFTYETILDIGVMAPNYSQFVECLENQQVYQDIISDTFFARNNQIPGTPAYVLVDTDNPQNARIFVGLLPIELILATLDEWQLVR